MACTCEAWNNTWQDDDGIHTVHSESCDHYDD
jgi:hypothetical protein